MNDTMSFLAPDGLLEFEAADIEEVEIDGAGAHVLLKDGHTCSLFGHEARMLLDRLGEGAKSPDF